MMTCVPLTNKTKVSDQESVKPHSDRGPPVGYTKPYSGQIIYGQDTERESQSNIVTYSDIRRMRQKGRLKVVAKRDGSANKKVIRPTIS